MTVVNLIAKERTDWATRRARIDPVRPQSSFVEIERSENGSMATVVTVLLTNRECPWRCLYCDLWKNTTSVPLPLGAIPAQLDFALEGLPATTGRHIKLYNAGSFFDPKAIPPDDFPAIIRRVAVFERVIVECHPALVSRAVPFQQLLLRSSSPSGNSTTPQLEVAMGLEIADDALLARLNKRMTLEMFRRATAILMANGIAVRAFVILKPPFVRTNADALYWAQRSIDFAFDCGASVLSLIPARFGPAALDELARAGEFSPPSLDLVEDSLDYGIAQRRGRVFVDLWDIETLNGCADCRPERVARLRELNLSQSLLPRIACSHASSLSPP